jgi:hypothetical protein
VSDGRVHSFETRIIKIILKAENYMKLHLHGMAGLLLSVAGSCALLQSAQAGSFTDTSRDLILVFRQLSADGTDDGAVEFEVDIGQASIYYGVTPGGSVPVTAYSPSAQLNAFFGSDLGGLAWSVAGCVPNGGDSGSSTKPPATLWVTDPRTADPTTSPGAWVRKSFNGQALPDGKIEAILNNAAAWGESVAADSATNTTTAVAIPSGIGDNADGSLGPNGNYLGDFFGNGEGRNDVENTTPSTFSTDGLPSRSDFYELQPGSGAGTYLGYFELTPSGTMTFYALPKGVLAPTLSVSQSGANVNISFTSTAYGTYTLYYTNAAGLTAPVPTWATVSTNIIGDGTVKTFQQSISGAGTFYTVGVH